MSFSRLSGFSTTIRGRSLIRWGRPFKAQIIVKVFLLKQRRMLDSRFFLGVDHVGVGLSLDRVLPPSPPG